MFTSNPGVVKTRGIKWLRLIFLFIILRQKASGLRQRQDWKIKWLLLQMQLCEPSLAGGSKLIQHFDLRLAYRYFIHAQNLKQNSEIILVFNDLIHAYECVGGHCSMWGHHRFEEPLEYLEIIQQQPLLSFESSGMGDKARSGG